MSYLFINNQEIKNDSGNPIPITGTVTNTGGDIAVSNFPVTQTVDGTVALDASSLAALENTTVDINNFPSVQTVDGTMFLDSTNITALQSVTATISNFPATQTVAGTVTLDAASLAALETVNANVTGSVSLDSGSLVSLENVTVNVGSSVEINNDTGNPIPVSGTVALDSDTKAALENTTVNVTFPSTQTVDGTVALDTASLAALETITVDTITNPVAVTGTFFQATQPISGTVSVNQPVAITDNDSSITVDGTVAINNFPSTQTVDGTVALDTASLAALETITVDAITNPVTIQDGGNSITVDGTVSVNQPVAITDNDSSITVDGTVAINNFPSTQTVDGTIALDAASLAALETTTVDTITNPVAVTGTFFQATQPISGTVTVQDGGNILTVDGSVSVSNFPTTQSVSLDSSSRDALENITATVTFPSSQTVDGTVALDAASLAALETINANVTGTVSLDSGSLVSLENVTVNVGSSVEINNDTGNPIPVIGSTINPFGKTVITVDDDTVQHTSTNRRKVSNYEITEFNTFQYTKDPLIWDEEVTGTASSTLDTHEATLVMSVGTTTGDRIERQTKRVLPYIPGRENEVIMHFKLNAQQTGIVKRLGILDETSGIYLEDDGTTYNVVLRKTTSGGVSETRIARANWNGDKLDGTGSSGITLDFTKFQTLVIEYNWFTGHAELKFIIGNYTHPIHQFEFNNSQDTVITNTPFLPIKWDIHNTTGAAGTHTMEISSYATLSEAGQVPLGVKNTVTTPITGINCTAAETFYPILSIRLRTDRIKGIVLPQHFQAAALDNSPLFYKVLLNPVLTGATTWNTYADTHIEYNTNATAVTEGDFVIDAGYIDPNGQGAKLPLDTKSAFQLGRESMGTTSEIITIAAATGSANKDVYASFGWIEVR